jgi:hypothetical protein
MTEIKKIYKVSKKYIWKTFRIPSKFVNWESRYSAFEIPGGIAFSSNIDGEFKALREAINKKGIPRYGLITFSDASWNFGDRYTVSGSIERIEILRADGNII